MDKNQLPGIRSVETDGKWTKKSIAGDPAGWKPTENGQKNSLPGVSTPG
jgi:hypothetical protein